MMWIDEDKFETILVVDKLHGVCTTVFNYLKKASCKMPVKWCKTCIEAINDTFPDSNAVFSF